jgi:putative DNA primase/helicase
LHLKLVNLVTEIAEGAEIADAELKAIVSGELTTAEHKHQPPFDFRPYATCWFGTNHMPHTRDFSDALFRRALVIPFNRKFKEGENADPHLKEKLAGELSGILNLALAAYADVLRRGSFAEPASCLRAKEEWRLEADQVAQFINERCEMMPDSRVESLELYLAYKQWTEDAGIARRLNRKNFTNRVQRRGGQPCKGTAGKRMIAGVRLKSMAEEEDSGE